MMVLAAFAAMSCAPTIYNYAFDMQQPSESGVDLRGKTAAVVYFDNLSVNDILFESSLASSFSRSLSESCPSADSAAVYTLPYSDSLDLGSKTVVADILTSTGRDVLFLFGVPSFSDGNYSQPIVVYDSMDKSDRILSFEANGTVAEDRVKAGAVIGEGISQSFVPTWREESFNIISFNGSKWTEAEGYAVACQWKKAIEIWMTLLDAGGDSSVRAAAEYNIALGCYMSDMSALAKEWLDRADKDYKYSCSSSLRRRL